MSSKFPLWARSAALQAIAETLTVVGTDVDYYNWPKPLSDRLDIWETTYVHPLSGVDAVADWSARVWWAPKIASDRRIRRDVNGLTSI
jgi:trans-aconitate 2-methyltransferase